jgi:hypothetical protein
MINLCIHYTSSFPKIPKTGMPRYDPVVNEESQPLIVQPTGKPQPNANVPRYQQLAAPTPQNQPTPRNPGGTRYQSPFVCQPCFDSFFARTAEAFKHYQPTRQQITGYLSGFLFALGWWMFIDGAVFNSVKYIPDSNMNVLSFEDWLPGILSSFALIIVNLIDRESLNADDDSYGDSTNVAMKARGCAFTGMSIAIGSLGGAIAILILKYVMPGVNGDGLYLVLFV